MDRLDRSGAFKPSHRRGISRYWSVPDRRLWVLFGPFSFRFVGYSVGEILDQNKKGPRVFP